MHTGEEVLPAAVGGAPAGVGSTDSGRESVCERERVRERLCACERESVCV